MHILNPIIRVEGMDHILMTLFHSGEKKIGSAASQRDKRIASLDLLFTGI